MSDACSLSSSSTKSLLFSMLHLITSKSILSDILLKFVSLAKIFNVIRFCFNLPVLIWLSESYDFRWSGGNDSESIANKEIRIVSQEIINYIHTHSGRITLAVDATCSLN